MPIFEDAEALGTPVGEKLERDGKTYIRIYDYMFAELLSTVEEIEAALEESANPPTVH